jgi:hypothetical protein
MLTFPIAIFFCTTAMGLGPIIALTWWGSGYRIGLQLAGGGT